MGRVGEIDRKISQDLRTNGTASHRKLWRRFVIGWARNRRSSVCSRVRKDDFQVERIFADFGLDGAYCSKLVGCQRRFRTDWDGELEKSVTDGEAIFVGRFQGIRSLPPKEQDIGIGTVGWM